MSGGGDFEAEGFINCENEINVLKVINYGKVMTTFLEPVRLPGLSSLHAVITKLFHSSCLLKHTLAATA